MGKLKKIIFFAVIALVLYFSATQLGFFGGVDQIQVVDAKYGIGEGRLVPGAIEELENYKRELRGIAVSGEEEKLVSVKLELVEMQKQMIAFRENSARINFAEPDCRVSGSVTLSRKNAENALAHAENALAKQRGISGITGFGHITSTGFDDTIGATMESISSQINLLKTVCPQT